VPESYDIRFKRSAEKELKKVPQPDLKRVIKTVESLAVEPYPHDSIKLSGVPGYRIRQGDWRVVYDVDDDAGVVTVRKVAHRRDVYR
jgi:mRNA interferase RelE/StbE